MLGIKQDALAADLGDDWNQQISLLEQKETIDAPLLEKISAALKIPVEAIQNFDKEQAVKEKGEMMTILKGLVEI